MGEFKFIKGDTIEAQMKFLDIVLPRIARRSFKTAAVVMPLVPLSFAADIAPTDGIICRVLCPLDCVIEKAYMHVEAITDKVKPVLTIQLKGIGGTSSRKIKFPYRVGLTTATPKLEITAGTRIIVSTTNQESVTGISLSLAVSGIAAQALKEEILLDQILKNLEVEDAAVEVEDAGKTEG
jgi:hypothetical protein